MPFIVPALPAIAKGAAGIGAGILGNKLSKAKPTEQEQNVLNLNTQAQQLGLDTAKSTLPQANNLISMGTNTMQPVLNYWASILSGGRGAATGAMAPELLRIGEGYRTASNTSAALSPRGGPSATFMSELPFQQQRDVSSLLQTARPQAATNLFQAGQGTAQTGGNILSNAVSALYGSTAAGREILSTQANLRALEAERGKSMGAGIFDIMQRYGFPEIDKIFKKGTGNNETFSY